MASGLTLANVGASLFNNQWGAVTTVQGESGNSSTGGLTYEALRRAYDNMREYDERQTQEIRAMQAQQTVRTEQRQLLAGGDYITIPDGSGWGGTSLNVMTGDWGLGGRAVEVPKPKPITDFSKWLEAKYNKS